MSETPLTTAVREIHELRAALKAHIEASKNEEARIRGEIRKRETMLATTEAGLDADKIALARTIVYATDYSKGGADRASCVRDAIKQLSTGKPIRPVYGDLWHYFFGTKNYDRWRGQREDCRYGYRPRHGNTCFEIGITKSAKERGQADLTPEEIEAAIYFLVNLERIQKAEKDAAEKASAA